MFIANLGFRNICRKKMKHFKLLEYHFIKYFLIKKILGLLIDSYVFSEKNLFTMLLFMRTKYEIGMYCWNAQGANQSYWQQF